MTDFFENLLSNGELQAKVAELQGKIDAYQMSENEANEIIAELKEEVRQLHSRNPEELYTLFGRPIKYWEQLEQENAELKAYKDVNEDFKTAWEELKAENDKLKEEVRTEKLYSSQIEELEESIVGQRNAYKKLNSLYIENCEYTGKLEQTLQEIKKIARKKCDDCDNVDGTTLWDDCEKICELPEIINIINKAEEE